MKKLLLILLILFPVLATNAGLDYKLGDTFQVIIEGPNYDGLPYKVDDLRDGLTGIDFETFCVESLSGSDELYWPGRTYWATIDNSVYYSPDPDGVVYLTDDTRKLYAAFVNGYDYTGNGYSYNALQTAIWYSLSGNNDDNALDDPYDKVADTNLAYQTYFDNLLNSISSFTTGYERVKVLNIWGPASISVTGAADEYIYDVNPDLFDRQSQLVMTVPAPGAILLAGVGTAFVGIIRRRSM